MLTGAYRVTRVPPGRATGAAQTAGLSSPILGQVLRLAQQKPHMNGWG